MSTAAARRRAPGRPVPPLFAWEHINDQTRCDLPCRPAGALRDQPLFRSDPLGRFSVRLRPGRQPRGWLARAGLQKQVQLAFDNLAAVLKAAGCTFDDVVDVTTFHTDPAAQWESINAVRLKAIGEQPYPNWTAVGVNWLAGFDFEIKVIARIPQSA